METPFWEKHYSSFNVIEPSSFAKFCIDSKIKDDDIVIEIGCGNGRDAVFLSSKVKKYIGLDACPIACEKSATCLSEIHETTGVDWTVTNIDASKFDFTNVTDGSNRLIIYSRFSMHSMNYEEEARLINALSKINTDFLLLVEVRTIFDEFYGEGEEVGRYEFVTDHYRRFVHPLEFTEKFSSLGMPIYTSLSKGYAMYKEEDPMVLRAVFDSILLKHKQ